eukprot:scaffold205662_cov18-Tisochrysis_lutea.AAC.1
MSHIAVAAAGPQKYADALKLLFDPSRSKAELISIKVRDSYVGVIWMAALVAMRRWSMMGSFPPKHSVQLL